MPPSEEPTPGELMRAILRLESAVSTLTQEWREAPRWPDISRIERNLVERAARLEDAMQKADARHDAAEVRRAQDRRIVYGALLTGVVSLGVALLSTALGGN